MAPEFTPLQLISLTGLVEEEGGSPGENDLYEVIEPDPDQGVGEGIDRLAQPEIGGVADHQDVGGDGLVVLDDIHHIMGGSFGILHEFHNPLDHCRKGRQLRHRLKNGFHEIHSSFSPPPEVFTQTFPDPISRRTVRLTWPPTSSPWMRTLFAPRIFRKAI
jgi:hypothetical protein